MRKILAIAALALACTSMFAQKVAYTEIKNNYDPKEYVKTSQDPYNVVWTGLESFAVPGMGHLIMGETGRGWAFLGADIAVGAVGGVFAQNLIGLAEKDSDGKWTIADADKDKARGQLAGMLVCGALELGIKIWSCIDGVKVAKVRNMYYQDKMGTHAFSMDLYPSIEMARTGSSATLAPGMTFAVRF